LATAAGVAGGALLFEGIRNLMGSNPGPFGQDVAQATPSPLPPPDADTTAQQQAMADDSAAQPADQYDDYDTASLDQDMGGGSDDDWA
ncbi:MAG: hypothetical protein ACREUF_11200, partial [Solimonas sp.]